MKGVLKTHPDLALQKANCRGPARRRSPSSPLRWPHYHPRCCPLRLVPTGRCRTPHPCGLWVVDICSRAPPARLTAPPTAAPRPVRYPAPRMRKGDGRGNRGRDILVREKGGDRRGREIQGREGEPRERRRWGRREQEEEKRRHMTEDE